MSDPNPQAQATAAPRRWTRIVLVVSLALNLLVIGAVSGAVLSGNAGKGDRRSGPPGERTISAPYVDAFTRQDKRALRKEMRAQFPNRREAMATNKKDYEAFLTLLREEDFDIEAATSIMERQMKRASETLLLGRQLAMSRISAMTQAERAAYADRLQERLSRMGKRKPAPKE